MKLFSAHFPIQPIAWQRVSLFKGRLIQSEKTRHFERDLKVLAKLAMGQRVPFDQPLSVNLIFLLERPSRFRNRLFPDVGNDVDNLTKAAFDSFNGIIWKDDCRVVELTAQKKWAIREGSVFVEVFSVSG